MLLENLSKTLVSEHFHPRWCLGFLRSWPKPQPPLLTCADLQSFLALESISKTRIPEPRIDILHVEKERGEESPGSGGHIACCGSEEKEAYPDGERRGGRNLPWQRKKMKSQGKVLEAVRKGQKMSQLFRVSFTTRETLKS